MVQIQVVPVINQGQANEILRTYSKDYPKRKIISISMSPVEYPGGWFMTIAYEVIV